MTETPESSARSAGANPLPPALGTASEEPRSGPPSRLNQVAAWVGIIAGVLFIVAVIFFAGLAIGRSTGGYHDWQHGSSGGQMAPCKAQHGGMMERGGMMNPGEMGPGQMRPGQTGTGERAPTRTPNPTPQP
ncbi:MAG: hypothetical protein K0U75_15185 [Actinomycetia bacterium]|nr:hypothetical protein [Actinomycetes bacterium]